MAQVGNDTYIAVTLTQNTNTANGAGIGDNQTTFIYRTGHAPGSLAWPQFHNNSKRTGTFDDPIPPTAGVGALNGTKLRTSFQVEWSGNDGQTGVAAFDVDMQQGGGERVRWIDGAAPEVRSGPNAGGSAVFYGLPGRNYRFWVRARDRAGNIGAFTAPVVTSIAGNAERIQPFNSAYAASGFGPISSVSSPPVRGTNFPNNVIRGIAALPTGGGYEVDSSGGLWAFGGAPPLNSSGYWRGWDIVRGMAMNRDGKGGYVLDGFGGLWPFGNARRITGPYWPNMDIARGVALTRGSTATNPKGYVVDAYGGVHRFGGAPAVTGSGYWPGQQMVRGIATDPVASGGYVLDAYGGMWPFGGAPKRFAGGYWPGRDIAARHRAHRRRGAGPGLRARRRRRGLALRRRAERSDHPLLRPDRDQGLLDLRLSGTARTGPQSQFFRGPRRRLARALRERAMPALLVSSRSGTSLPTSLETTESEISSQHLDVASRPGPFQRLRIVWAYRELLMNFTRKELKVKYKNSALGFFWSLLNPALYLVVFYVVFQIILQNKIPYFAIFLLAGLLPWNLFSTGLGGATGSIVVQRGSGREGLVPARDPAARVDRGGARPLLPAAHRAVRRAAGLPVPAGLGLPLAR